MELKASLPSKSRNAVIFACDAGHLPFARFAAERILRVEPEGDFDVVIAMPDIAQALEQKEPSRVRFVEIDVALLPDVPMVKGWISNATYFRWVLPQNFQADYDRILYLDTDTYLARPGLSRLFLKPVEGVPLAACLDFRFFVRLDRWRERRDAAKLRDLGGMKGEYYNAGVLLMEPAAFIESGMPQRFVEAAKQNVQFLPIHKDQDQGAMNLAFADEITPLNPLYNWASRWWLNQEDYDCFQPYIIHFSGRGKPWNLQDNPFIQGYSDEYIGWLSEHYPELEQKAPTHSLEALRKKATFGNGLLETFRMRFHSARIDRKMRRVQKHDREDKYARMQAAISGARIG